MSAHDSGPGIEVRLAPEQQKPNADMKGDYGFRGFRSESIQVSDNLVPFVDFFVEASGTLLRGGCVRRSAWGRRARGAGAGVASSSIAPEERSARLGGVKRSRHRVQQRGVGERLEETLDCPRPEQLWTDAVLGVGGDEHDGDRSALTRQLLV